MSKHRKERPWDALFDYACSLRNSGKPDEAVSEFELLHESYPDETLILFMLGVAYFEADRFAKAVACAELVVKRKPTHELSSLLLFHSLSSLGRKDEAIAEMHRFLAVADSSNYEEIRNELEQLDADSWRTAIHDASGRFESL